MSAKKPRPRGLRGISGSGRRTPSGGIIISDGLVSCPSGSGPSCADWLSGTSDTPPGHNLCLEVMTASVRAFADTLGGQDSEYLKTWPLPAGRKAIANWHFGPLRSADWQDPLSVKVDVLARAAQGIEPETPVLPVPPSVVARETAWLAFVAERVTDTGRLRLLGLVERLFEGIISNAREEVIAAPETVEVEFEIAPLEYESDQPDGFSLALKFKGHDGRSVADARASWLYIAPAVLIEAYPSTAADLDALTAAVRPLLDWYNEALLGKTFRTGGRPAGSTAIPDSEFEARYRAAYQNWCATRDDRPTAADIIAELAISKTTFYETLKRLKLRWPPSP